MNKIIEFLKYRYVAYIVSFTLLVTFSIGTYLNKGINFGIDFVGGTKLIAKFDQGIKEADIRQALNNFNPMVQKIGDVDVNEYIIAIKLSKKSVVAEKELDSVKGILLTKFINITFLSEEKVGPAIGDFLKKSAIKLFTVALVLMTIYLTFRFEFKYSVGAMSALVHDIGLAVLFCGITGIEFNIPVVAALLTIFGYSINDTIVIFDRIRENIHIKSNQTFVDTINKSISQSLSRTLLTSLTTLFAVLSLYFLGGDVLNDFALVLIFGIFVGTYSSIYVAASALMGWEKFRSRKK